MGKCSSLRFQILLSMSDLWLAEGPRKRTKAWPSLEVVLDSLLIMCLGVEWPNVILCGTICGHKMCCFIQYF